ncbi:NnrU family protein [Polaromonas jejuensis]|uniref:NnrU family protein n=1 Tax=Polaromonas jejuensis TaxID=457502 RepID=A0ABW0QGD1_9BURK|nr:isoprenylcysteine carboxylmethyltransferase family protein [Polaromonas jejuensis]
MMASLLENYGAALIAFSLFAVLHSIGAHEPLKNALARWTSPFFVEHFWRLVYCALSLAALYGGVAALLWGRHAENDVWLFIYPEWLWQVLTAIHLGSIGLLYAAFLQSDYLEFLGLKQAWHGLRMLANRAAGPALAPSMALFGSQRLVTTGVYAWVRHPMLVGGLVFLLTSGPSLNNLVYTAMYVIYMLAGSLYEERRLVRVFGEDYLRYRARVGAFCPRFWPRRAG